MVCEKCVYIIIWMLKAEQVTCRGLTIELLAGAIILELYVQQWVGTAVFESPISLILSYHMACRGRGKKCLPVVEPMEIILCIFCIQDHSLKLNVKSTYLGVLFIFYCSTRLSKLCLISHTSPFLLFKFRIRIILRNFPWIVLLCWSVYILYIHWNRTAGCCLFKPR